ncbi:MAG TPA: hypothetical protein VGN08_00285 [Solirubrobacteraceae bacterium]|jgi:hypothetical protein
MRPILVFAVTALLGAFLLVVYASVWLAEKTALMRPRAGLLPR